MNKVLIILGMHRSGTSLISRWLMECGLNIGDKLFGPNIGNEEGHFEDLDFLKLHEEILVGHDLPETGLTEIKLDGLGTEAYQKMSAIVANKNSLHREWGWKEPRTCLFLDHYRNLIPTAKYIVIVRDYHEVVNSLVKRDFKKMEHSTLTKRSGFYTYLWRFRRKKLLANYYQILTDKYLGVWIAYNKAICDHLNKLKREDFILVNHGMLLRDASGIINHLTQSWHFTLNFFDFRKIYNEKMLGASQAITDFVKDRQLITHADSLLARLATYDFIKKGAVYANNGY